MRVRVLYFAAVREIVGRDEEDVELPESVLTVASFVSWLEGARSVLAGRLASVRIARNECFARADEQLAEGDVLALIPPVAGG